MITTSPHACPSLCMVSNFYERWTQETQTTSHGRRGYASYPVDPSYYQTLLIAFWPGYALLFMIPLFEKLAHHASFLVQGVRVKESTVFTRKYCTELTSLSMLSVFEVEIWCYRGGNTIPKWISRQAGTFNFVFLFSLLPLPDHDHK